MLPRLPESDMAVSCSPSDLMEGAKCYSTCLLNEELSAIELWLLTQIAGTTTDVQTLLNNSKCLENCVEHGNSEAIIVWLLAKIANVNNDPNSLMSAARCIEACIIPEESKAIDVYLEVQIAGSTSDLTALLNNARCFRLCSADWRGTAIKIYLLAIKAGVSTDPATLIGSANCLLGCLNHDQLKLVETWLWCQIANASPPPVLELPQTIPGLAHWWRADSLKGIVADGGAVGDVGKEWICKITGIKAAQSSAPSRPTFVANWSGGQPALRMTQPDAVTRFLTLSSGFSFSGDVTLIGVYELMSPLVASAQVLNFLTSHITAATMAVQGNTFPGLQRRAHWDVDGGGSLLFPLFSSDISIPNSVAMRRTGAGANNCNAFRNNADLQVGTLNGTNSVTRISGSAHNGTTHQCHLAEILHYSNAVSNADLTLLYNNYFQPRYSL